jgi:hypothetical protein
MVSARCQCRFFRCTIYINQCPIALRTTAKRHGKVSISAVLWSRTVTRFSPNAIADQEAAATNAKLIKLEIFAWVPRPILVDNRARLKASGVLAKPGKTFYHNIIAHLSLIMGKEF